MAEPPSKPKPLSKRALDAATVGGGMSFVAKTKAPSRATEKVQEAALRQRFPFFPPCTPINANLLRVSLQEYRQWSELRKLASSQCFLLQYQVLLYVGHWWRLIYMFVVHCSI